MAVDLLDYLKGGDDTPRLWVNFNRYAKNYYLEVMLTHGQHQHHTYPFILKRMHW